jgi:cellulose synthase/poly-beta-1,6-N-acetylglucosamine synthase-like glycosyltransferase
MNGVLAALALVIFSINVYFIFWVYHGLKKIVAQPLPLDSSPQSFSVIIAARDEADRIDNCLRVLADQNYPKEKYEVVVIADRCTDKTVQVANQFKDRFINFKILEIREVPDGISPKKHALTKGIEEAAFNRFLFLDADVVPTPNHIQAMNSYFDGEGDAVVGIMKLTLQRGFWQSFLKYERLLNWSVAVGSIGNGNPMVSYGGNWGYTRNAFEKLKGFEGIYKSLGGDDDLLLQKFGRKKLSVRFCSNPDGWVSTPAPDSFRKFLQQRRRHFAAGKYYQLKFRIAYFLYHTSNVAVWIMPFIYPISAFLLFLKIVCNTALLYNSKKIFKEKMNPLYVPVFEIFFMLYAVLVGMLGSWGRIKW